MEFNIAEIITIALFVVSCTGYIKRELGKLNNKQKKQLEETNHRIDELKKEVEGTQRSLTRVTKLIGGIILENEKVQVQLNKAIVKRIDDIYKKL